MPFLDSSTRRHLSITLVALGLLMAFDASPLDLLLARPFGTPTGFPNDCEDAEGLTHWYVLHAEANAIMKVARSTNNARSATLYLTHSPCKECSKLILQAGIKRLVYLNSYKDPSGLELLQKGGVMLRQLEMP